MHAYRTHTCGQLTDKDAGNTARISGWVHRVRDHGGVLFIDLRDHYGITQCVFPAGSPAFAAAEAVRPESVITVTGTVVNREAGTVNPKLPTGEIELKVRELVVQSTAEVLPMQVAGDERGVRLVRGPHVLEGAGHGEQREGSGEEGDEEAMHRGLSIGIECRNRPRHTTARKSCQATCSRKAWARGA